MNAGSASATFNLPYSLTAYTITAVYSGDAVNAGSASSVSPLTITQGNTATALSANTTTTALGHPASITANVTSVVWKSSRNGQLHLFNNPEWNSDSARLRYIGRRGGLYFRESTGRNRLRYSYLHSQRQLCRLGFDAHDHYRQPANDRRAAQHPIALPYTMTAIAGGSGLASPSSGNP